MVINKIYGIFFVVRKQISVINTRELICPAATNS